MSPSAPENSELRTPNENSELRTPNSELKQNSELRTPNSELKRRAYDRFRGRVMFPIYSISGRVLGFSGRILSSEKQAAKYVNSPDSDIYNKSRILYGLYQAVGHSQGRQVLPRRG